MTTERQKATLFVDGTFLRKQIQESGETYNAQSIAQFLTRGVRKIQSIYPELDLSIFYYGVRPSTKILHPISQTPLNEEDMKRSFFKVQEIAGVPFQAFWGRMAKTVDAPWIMKPTSYLKAPIDLTDEDFEPNIPSKGVLTKMVDMMAEKATLKNDSRLIVWGDEPELKYALGMMGWQDMPVDQIKLKNNEIELVASTSCEEPVVFDKNAMEKVVKSWRHMGDVPIEEFLPRLRSVTDNPTSLLLLDAGVIRKFLKHGNYALGMENVQKVLMAIEEKLAASGEREAICYHAFPPKEMFPHPKTEHKLKKLDEDIDLEVLKGFKIHPSMGQMYQFEKYPYILKQDKWGVPQEVRGVRDFDINVHQQDVDDRLAYDMALARFSPKIQNIYILTTDGDFLYSVQKAKEVGIKVNIISIGDIPNQMSMQLLDAADGVIYVDHLAEKLTTQEAIKAKEREEHERQRKEQLRQEKRLKRQQFVPVDEEDIDEVYGETLGRRTKKEKIGQQRAKYRKAQYERMKESFLRDKNRKRGSR